MVTEGEWPAALTESPPFIGHLWVDVMTRYAQRTRGSARQSGEARPPRGPGGARSASEHGRKGNKKPKRKEKPHPTPTGHAYIHPASNLSRLSTPLPAV